ncbi:ATP-grasp domain-containing protein [Blastococcus saxobsidens]|uniref:ATP-grasp domain-containing protein n=1 Tax=Blastococcus saxobsidens TaxID=138336 RepID=A0A6L9W4T2_9ACTN|nr:ATP-grasp domain-containing protein [Blastococcus saxobsidens]NEK87073.1 ATP-grasp domain-containing protein [Blastococcus saxobsidens]
MASTAGGDQGEEPAGGEPWFVAVELPVRARAACPELGAGERLDAPGAAQLERARWRGLRTAVLTRDRGSYGEDVDWVADRWIECDTLHPESIVAAVGELDGPVAALTSAVDDFVGPAAVAARALGLRGPTPGSPALAHDEGVLRAALAAAGIALAPWVSVAADDPGLESAVGYPCVVAPVDAGRTRDVGLVADGRELRALAARHAARAAYGRGVRPRRRLLVEQYVEGPRYCADGVVAAGEPVILAWSDQLMSLPPDFTEMALTATRQPPAGSATAFVEAVLAAAGYDFGPFHLEFVLGPTGPLLTALHPRPAGAGAQQCVDLVSGVDTADLAVALLLGEAAPDACPAPAAASTRMCVMAHAAGRVRAVGGLREVASIPGLVVAEVFTDVGGETGAPTGEDLGHVVTVGCTPEQARRRAAYALDGIRVDVEELQTV